MLKDMAAVAAECIRAPRGNSIWSPELDKYVCPQSEIDSKQEAKHLELALIREQKANNCERTWRPSIGGEFKLVFFAAVGGTLFFTLICVVLTIFVRQEQPDLVTGLVTHLLDLVKIGFGAIVGLLGAKGLQSREAQPG